MRIQHDGQERDLTPAEEDAIRDAGMVYYCRGCRALHPEPAVTWEQIDHFLNPTVVVFRWWRNSVIALFPGTDADGTGRFCDSFQHIGQHGGAAYTDIVHESRPATPKEYKALKAELENAPYFYRLRIRQRHPSRLRTIR